MSKISQLSELAIPITVSVTITVTVSLSSRSFLQLLPVPQQPNHVVCHMILWVAGVVPFSTNRKRGVTGFFLFENTSCLFLSFVKSFVKCDGNVGKKVCCTLVMVSLVLLGLSTRFKNWCIVWRLLQYTSQNRFGLSEAPSCCYVILKR